MALILILLAGCVTPVIPLPPPEPERYALEVGTQKDSVVIVGPADPAHHGALIFVLNVRTGHGLITQSSPADGSFRTEPLPVQDRDQLDVWAGRGTEATSSDVRCAVVDFAAARLQRCD